MGHHGLTVIAASYCLTGLIAFFFFLIPGVEFLQQVLGGLITDLDDFILGLSGMIPGFDISQILYLAEAGSEVALFNAYPLHWTLMHRPDDAWMIALQIIPWLASGAIIGGLFPENPKEALIIGVGMILSNSMLMVTLYMIIPAALMGAISSIPMVGPILTGILNGVAQGFTDLPMGWSAVLTQVEGGGMFTAMVLFMSTLKGNESSYPESSGGSNAALGLATIGASLTGFLGIVGLIMGIVNTVKNPGDRKAIAALIIGAMSTIVFILVVLAIVALLPVFSAF